MKINTPLPETNSRREALYDFLVHHLLQGNGRPPTIREIIEAKVGENTEAGPLTSTSVVKANLAAMAEMGWIAYRPGQSRHAQIVGGYYVVADNVLRQKSVLAYDILVFDESAGIREPVNPESQKLFDWFMANGNKVCITFSGDEQATIPDIWGEIYKPHAIHYYYLPFLELLARAIKQTGIDSLAVVTANEAQSALAAAAGFGVFAPVIEENEWNITANSQNQST